MSEVRGQGARLQPPGRCDATGQQAGQGVHVCVRLCMHIYECTSMMGDVGGDTGNWLGGGGLIRIKLAFHLKIKRVSSKNKRIRIIKHHETVQSAARADIYQ